MRLVSVEAESLTQENQTCQRRVFVPDERILQKKNGHSFLYALFVRLPVG